MRRRRTPNTLGPKALLYEVLLPHFRKPVNSARLVYAFLGSACEQWMNGEYFQAIATARRDLWIRPEKLKHDLVFYLTPQKEMKGGPSLVIESKVVYSPEAPSVQRTKLKRLADQLQSARDRFGKDCTVVGLIVLFDYRYRAPDSKEWRPVLRRDPFPSRAKTLETGLTNCFGGKSARVSLWGESGPRLKAMGGFLYRIEVFFEIVNLANSS